MLQHASMPSIARQNLYVGAQYLQWALNLWANEVNQKINILQVVCLELGVLLNMGRFYHFYRDGAAMVLACLGMAFLTVKKMQPKSPKRGIYPSNEKMFCWVWETFMTLHVLLPNAYVEVCPRPLTVQNCPPFINHIPKKHNHIGGNSGHFRGSLGSA